MTYNAANIFSYGYTDGADLGIKGPNGDTYLYAHFQVDAQAMTALLYDFATHADYRAAVKREFDGIKALFGEYQEALRKVYTNPVVPDAK